MSGQDSELIELSKLNGDFKKNYGKLIGAYLYLRSITAARGRSYVWSGLLVGGLTAGLHYRARLSLQSVLAGTIMLLGFLSKNGIELFDAHHLNLPEPLIRISIAMQSLA